MMMRRRTDPARCPELLHLRRLLLTVVMIIGKDLQILTAAVHRLGPLADLDLVDPPGPNTLAGGAGLQVGVGTGPGHVTVSTK